MPTKSRISGSGFTTFHVGAKTIAFLQVMEDSGQQPLGQGYEDIYQIGSKRAVEIATNRVLAPGMLRLQMKELWNEPVWYQFSERLRGKHTITDVWEALEQNGVDITCSMVIRPPSGAGSVRTKTYLGCKIVGIPDGERVEIAGLSIDREVLVRYMDHKWT